MTPKSENMYLQKALSIFASISIAVGGWFLSQAWNEINLLNSKVHAVEIAQASTTGNRFTSNDWAQNKAILDQQLLGQDRRIVVLEENTKAIKELLGEIKNDLKEIKSK